MKTLFTAPCVFALLLCLPPGMSVAHAQTATPGTNQMRDVQRKAEQKARSNQSRQRTTQHQAASAAAPASSP